MPPNRKRHTTTAYRDFGESDLVSTQYEVDTYCTLSASHDCARPIRRRALAFRAFANSMARVRRCD